MKRSEKWQILSFWLCAALLSGLLLWTIYGAFHLKHQTPYIDPQATYEEQASSDSSHGPS